MFTIFKRELKSYFYSPIGYVYITVSMILYGLFFILTNIAYGASNIGAVFGIYSFLFIIFLFLMSILTMRLFSEERKNKTDQLLLTSPIKLTSIVLGKFFAAYSVFLSTVILSLTYPVILAIFGEPSFTEIFAVYIAYILIGASFTAIGLFVSTLTENQIISAIVTFGILLVIWVSGLFVDVVNGAFAKEAIRFISLTAKYEDFSKGLFAIAPIVYYISFTGLFVFLTVQVLERRRWN